MRQRVDDLPDAGDAGAATDEAEGDIGAERRCRAQVREARPAEHRSGVGRPPAEAGASRNLFVERDRRRAPGEGERPSHQVVLVWTDRLGTVRSHNRERVTRSNLKSVVKIKRDHLGIDQVIAIVAPPVARSERVSLAGAMSVSGATSASVDGVSTSADYGRRMGLGTHPYVVGLCDVGQGSYAWLQPDGGWGWSNAGLIVDGDEALLVDTLYDVPLTQTMLDGFEAALPGVSITTLVNTHSNGDHCNGNELLHGAEILTSVIAAEEMTREKPALMVGLLEAAPTMGSSVNSSNTASGASTSAA